MVPVCYWMSMITRPRLVLRLYEVPICTISILAITGRVLYLLNHLLGTGSHLAAL